MSASTSKSVFAALVAASVLLGAQWTWAGSLPVWGGTTTTKQPQVQQPSKPLVSEPGTVPAQTVPPTQPGLRTSPVTTRSFPVSTPVQQRVSLPQTGGAETLLSVAQDECVVFTKIWNPDPYSDSSVSTASPGVAAESVANFFGNGGGGSMGTARSDEEIAAEYDNFYFIKGYVVLEKGDYQAMYLQDLNFLRNINKNNFVEITVRLPGINKVSPGPDDWTKGRKSRITLRPGETAEFDAGSGATLIKVRCP